MRITAFVGVPGCSECNGFYKVYANAAVAYAHAEDRLRTTILKQDAEIAIEKAAKSVALALEERYTAREAVHQHEVSHTQCVHR